MSDFDMQFSALFGAYKTKMGISDDRGLCSVISLAFETLPEEKQIELLNTFIKDNKHSLRDLVLTFARSGADITLLTRQVDAFNASKKLTDQAPGVQPTIEKADPKAGLPKAAVKAPEEGGQLVPSSTAAKVLISRQPGGVANRPQPSVMEEPADEEGGGGDGEDGSKGEDKTSVPNTPPQPKRPPRPGVRNTSVPVNTQQNNEEVAPNGLKAWFVNRMEALKEWRERLGSGKSSSAKGSAGGSSFDFGDFLATKWQMLVMGILALAVFGLVFFLGPASGGDDGSGGNSVLTFGSLQNVPFILFVIVIITFVLFLESNDRGDGVDAWLVIISVTLSSIAMKYKPQLTQITGPGDEPWGWMILGFLYFAPYLIIYIAVAVNRTRNIFASNMFKKLDFTPLYMCFLLFWSLAQAHKYWDFIPNPCLFPEGFYLGVGLIGLLLELSGNMVNLLVAVVGGVVSGLLIFNGNTTIYSIPNYVWVFVIYMLAMLYGFSDSATSQGTINMDSSKNEGGMSFGSTVKTKRFVPYDMYGGMVWLTAIVAIFYYGNPAFSLVSPF